MLATTVMDPEGLFEIWVSEVDRPRLRRLVARPGLDCFQPVWSADGDALFHGCRGLGGSGGLYRTPVDHPADSELVLGRDASSVAPAGTSPDGAWLSFIRSVDNRPSLFLLRIDGEGDGEPLPLGEGPGREAVWSPEGRFLAYVSLPDGSPEIVVAPFTDGRAGRPIRLGPGITPFWNPSVRDELRFWTTDGRLVRARIAAGGRPEPETVIDLGEAENRIVASDPLPDGRTLVVVRGEDERNPTRVDVVLGLDADLRRLVPSP